MKLSIRNKLILATAVIAGIAASIVTGIIYLELRQIVITNEIQKIEVLTSSEANELKQIFISSEQLADTVANDQNVIDYVAGISNLPEADINYLLANYNIGDAYSAIYIMRNDGLTVASTDTEFINENYNFRPYFTSAIRGQVTTSMAIGTTSLEPGYYSASPIRNSEGAIIGVATVKRRTSEIQNLLQSIGKDDYPDLKVMFTDNQGIVIASTEEDRLFRSIAPISDTRVQRIENARSFADQNIQETDMDYKLAQAAIFREVEHEVIIEGEGLAGSNNTTLTLSKVNGYPFYLILEDDVTISLTSELKNVLYISALIPLFAALAIISISVMVDKLMRPINELTQVTDKVAKGDYSQTPNIKSGDELENLGKTLKYMIERLRDEKQIQQKMITDKEKDLREMTKAFIEREQKIREVEDQLKKITGKVPTDE